MLVRQGALGPQPITRTRITAKNLHGLHGSEAELCASAHSAHQEHVRGWGGGVSLQAINTSEQRNEEVTLRSH